MDAYRKLANRRESETSQNIYNDENKITEAFVPACKGPYLLMFPSLSEALENTRFVC